jgi:ATP-dependent DNA helicase RecG
VGRGEHASLCLLCGPKASPRLSARARHDDGFELAEIDLQLRKEGELIGTRQSGLGQFVLARMPEDEWLLMHARACAEAVIGADPQLAAPEHTLLADRLAALFGEIEAHAIAA